MSAGIETRSRLDRMVARLLAQRACLAWAARAVEALPGPVLELGLGKGRTYDHIRRLLPGRTVLAFDRSLHALPDCMPPDDCLLLGDIRETLPATLDRLAEAPVLVHADLGSDDRMEDSRFAAAVGALLEGRLPAGAVVLSDRDLRLGRAERVPQPETDGGWPYFLYRVR